MRAVTVEVRCDRAALVAAINADLTLSAAGISAASTFRSFFGQPQPKSDILDD